MVLAAILAAAGCAPVSTPAPSSGPIANAAFPAFGTSWKYRDTLGDGSQSIATSTARPVSHRGRDYYGVSDGASLTLRDPSDFNVVMRLQDDKEVMRMAPSAGTYSWPLWVGKAWTITYSYDDFERGRSWNRVDRTWRVTAYEDVTVPAGTFKAFKMESLPGANDGVTSVIWYSPEAKLPVKSIDERLSSNYLGARKTTSELMDLPR